MNDKFLTEKGWKDLLASCKGKIKDNGLQRALWVYEKLAEDKYDERLKRIVDVAAFAGNLRRAKDVSVLPDAVKYVAGVANAAEFERREIVSAKEAAEKVAEEAADRELMERQKSEQEDEEEKDPEAEANYRKLGKDLKAGLQLVQSGGGKPAEWVSTMADSTLRSPAVGLMIAAKIGSQHKQLLTKVTGSKRFAEGQCLMEQGKLTFVLDGYTPTQVGLKALRRSIQFFTGKNLSVRLRDQKSALEEDPDIDADGVTVADDDDDQEQEATGKPASGQTPKGHQPKTPEGNGADTTAPPAADPTAPPAADVTAPLALSASVGRGGKNKPEDVQAVQAALNKRAKVGLTVDGQCGPKTIAAIVAFQKTIGMSAPDGLVEPGKQTEAALNGKTVSPAGKGAGKSSSGTAKGGASGADGATDASGNPITDAGKAAIDLLLKAAAEAERRRKQIEQAYLDALKQILKALEQVSGVAGEEGKKIKEALEEAYKKSLEHLKEIQKAASELEKKKTQQELEALKKLVEAAEGRLKTVVDHLQKASEWLKKYAGDLYKGAKDLAKEVARKVAEGKKKADDAYKDVADKLKKAEDELGAEGKKIKEDLDKAYKENQERLKDVAHAAKDLAVRGTEEAAQQLQKAADTAGEGFKAVQDLAQRGLDWWNSD